MLLGVNIDHIATLREARKINDPDPLEAVYVCEKAGADQITIHLREDRRHIHDTDAERIVQNARIPVNIESSIDPDIIGIICRLKPHRVTLVPEKREEVTTEGGLDVHAQKDKIRKAIDRLQEQEIEVSLFIDPSREVVLASEKLGADMVELHTGHFANLHLMMHSSLPRMHHAIPSLQKSRMELQQELEQSIASLTVASRLGNDIGLIVAAGHGINYHNIKDLVQVPGLFELNIGQSIIARSVFTGLYEAVEEMKLLLPA